MTAFRRQAGIGDEETIVLYVGRLSEEKRPEWVIELASELDDVDTRVVMIGDGPLRKQAEEAAESDAIVWIPDLEPIGPAMAAADLLVLPSRIEGIPMVAMEALAFGTPIVATRVGGLPDLEREEGVTLVDPDNFGAFVDAVKKSLATDYGTIELPGMFRVEVMLDHYDRLLFGDETKAESSPGSS
jgi:glycosyltransferase involved in cell wall biosynthesis